MRLFPVFFAFLSLLSSQTMTKSERDRAMSELHASRKQLIDAVTGLNQKQLEFKVGAEQWSIAGITEHLAMTEELLFSTYKQVAASPATPDQKAKQTDEELMKGIRSREQRVQAPPMLIPKASFANFEEALSAFKQRRDRSIQFVETNQDTELRRKIVPNFGMDAYQIFLLLASHTQRHVEQINEIKRALPYPR
jgi:hypothetical protein